jgi:hypothetical protein
MTNDLDDRLSRRLQTAADDADNSSPDETDGGESGGNRNAQHSQKAQNIKKEWNVRSFYLDNDLNNNLTTAFKRLDLALSEADAETDLKKTRHFYPLIVELGLERLEEMDITEVTERLEDSV